VGGDFNLVRPQKEKIMESLVLCILMLLMTGSITRV
jgi:hypothetical protein